jgi:HEAT repeat protein
MPSPSESSAARFGSSGVLRWMNRVAPVYPAERPVAWLCFGVNFLVVTGIMLGRNARDSLFLTYVGVQYLPYMYFANALFLVLCSVGYTALVDRLDRGRFLRGAALLFAASLVLSRIALRGNLRWFYAALYIQAQVIWYFSLMLFWTFAGELFETRQAKRLFPLFGVGALLGMVSVGITSRPLVRALGTPNLLLVWAGLILAALLLGSIIYRRYWTPMAAPAGAMATSGTKSSEWRTLKEGFREVSGEPLLRSMAGYTLLLWTVYAVVDFSFNKTMRARYTDPNALTAFFGSFVGAQGLLCLLVQLFLTRPVISRLGVGATIQFHPAFLAFGTAWMSLRFGYASVLTTKLGDATMLYTFSDSSYQLLYNPVPPERRARVRGFIEGYIKPISLIGAGALVLIGDRWLRPVSLLGRSLSAVQELSWAAFAMAAVWLMVASGARKGYLGALLANLKADIPSLRHAAAMALAKLQDARSQAALLKALEGERPELIVAALQLEESFHDEAAGPMIARLLKHPEARVRATAASSLGRMGDMRLADSLLPLLTDADARVRANAIEALAPGPGAAAAVLDSLRPLLSDPSRRVRLNAALALAALGDKALTEECWKVVHELAQGDVESRIAAAYALGRVPDPRRVGLSLQLLNDSELSVRSRAARALGEAGNEQAVPALVQALAGPPELRQEARRSIVRLAFKGEQDLTGEPLSKQLTTTALTSAQPEIRSELADVLGRLPVKTDSERSQVIETLTALLRDPEWRVRWKVLKAFERLARTAPLPEGAREALIAYARIELANTRQSILYSRALGLPAPVSPSSGGQAVPARSTERALLGCLAEDRVRTEERLFRLLAIFAGREPIQEIFDKVRSGDARLRSDALEALETLAPKEIARDFTSLLEPEPGEEPGTPLSAESALKALAHSPKPWMRAVTAYFMGYHPEVGVQLNRAGLLSNLLEDPAPTVRETALYAGWLALKETWQPQVLAAMASSDPARRRAAQRVLAESESISHPQPAAGWPTALTGADQKGFPAQASEGEARGRERKAPMLLTVEKVLFLKSAPLFAALDSEELAALAEVAFQQEYEKGAMLFEHNRVPKHLYLIVRGRVEVFYRIEDRERLVAVLGEGENLGEMALLEEEARPRSASVRAVEPTLVLKIDRDNFRELILERPQMAFAIFKILVQRLRHRDLEAADLPALSTERHYA